MTRYAAFLRGINVGGHTVTKAQLVAPFEALGFDDVSTVINSGNVIFSTTSRAKEATLEKKVETALRDALGYDVDTFLRTEAEVTKVAQHDSFAKAPPRAGDNVHVIFLKQPLTAAATKAVVALSNDDDGLAVVGREVYWLRRGKMMDSSLEGSVLWKTIAVTTTTRTQRTVARVAAKLG